jgi:ElaB/YqjD/DUF883 family membrane-anchored ribosome-binding protein
MKTLAIILVILIAAIVLVLIAQQPQGPTDLQRLRDDAHAVGHDAVKATQDAADRTRDAAKDAVDRTRDAIQSATGSVVR